MNLSYFTKLEPWLQAFAGLAALLALAVVVRFLMVLVFMPVLRRIRNRANSKLTDVVLADAAIRRMAQVLPLMVMLIGIEEVPYLTAKVVTVMGNIAMAFVVIQIVRSLLAMLDAHLAQQPFMVGDSFTMADIPIACEIHRWRALPLSDTAPLTPHLDRWYQVVSGRPTALGVLDQPLT